MFIKELMISLIEKNIATSIFIIVVITSIATYFISTSLASSAAETGISTIETVEEASESSSSLFITVDVSGAVLNPGTYTLPKDSRLNEVIAQSGGILTETSQKWFSRYINLSRKLKDEEKIYIPFDWEIENEEKPNIASLIYIEENSKIPLTPTTNEENVEDEDDLININTADKKSLIDMPGIGDVTAQKIIDNRPYANEAELQSKAGITTTTLNKFKDLIKYK